MIMSLLGLIPGLFTTVNGITNAIANERLKLIDAKTEQARIVTQERITSLQAKRDVLVAESGRSNINAIIRGLIGASVAGVLGKLLVWDKVVGSIAGCSGSLGSLDGCHVFRTDPLDANQWGVITAVIGFYFLYEAAVNVTRIAKA
jgi:hypothetical protein